MSTVDIYLTRCFRILWMSQGDYLKMEMNVKNTGDEDMHFTTALHTYFSIDDISKTSVEGVGEHHYNDTAQGGRDCYDPNTAIAFTGGMVDRVYKQAAGPAHILSNGTLVFTIEKSASFPDTVVWNIGSDSLGDMPAGDYKKYVCVESAAAVDPIKVAPHESWTAEQKLTRSLPATNGN
mmetsp:Transcript_4310/g.3504  ORF Transcript_4310/g.3504 Transcript_4310/m.3504 type:complete len:179 (-) Transcript_4310:54-590(-)